MRDYKNLEIWRLGMEIASIIYELVDQMPSIERYNLQSQMIRSAISVPSNIAEGAGRSSEKEFKRFLEIALGSLYELETQLILTKQRYSIENLDFDELFELINKEQRKVSSFINRLN
ncbi:MAG TPA: four helix bundle protein [Saprospiraceae bacterium]|nr:four helix bundle protein [Saprospiraceae bacterium]HPG09227.1 four helix bundle protein [Saprospiraceae bacterium]HRV87421.1 four helix bundle protein [Saprospiraceae bacterium]